MGLKRERIDGNMGRSVFDSCICVFPDFMQGEGSVLQGSCNF